MITLSNKISPADAEFITELVAQCYPLILSTAKKCGPAEDTEDIIAESSLYLLRYIGLLRDMESSRQQAVYIYKVVQRREDRGRTGTMPRTSGVHVLEKRYNLTKQGYYRVHTDVSVLDDNDIILEGVVLISLVRQY